MGKAFLKIFLGIVLFFVFNVTVLTYLGFAANSLFEPKSVMKESENMICLTSSSFSVLILTLRCCWTYTVNRKTSQFWLSTFSSWPYWLPKMYLNWLAHLDLLVSLFCQLTLPPRFEFLPSSTTLLRNLSSSCSIRPAPSLSENMLLQFLQIMEENYIILKAIALLIALNIHVSTLLFPSPLTSASAHTGAPSAIGGLSVLACTLSRTIFHCHYRKGLTL